MRRRHARKVDASTACERSPPHYPADHSIHSYLTILTTARTQSHETRTPLISLVCVILVHDEGLGKRGSLLEQDDETRASSSIGSCASRPISRLTRAIALVPGNVPILRARIPVPRTHFITLAAAHALHRHFSAAEGFKLGLCREGSQGQLMTCCDEGEAQVHVCKYCTKPTRNRWLRYRQAHVINIFEVAGKAGMSLAKSRSTRNSRNLTHAHVLAARALSGTGWHHGHDFV
jgi:hypothetical protein